MFFHIVRPLLWDISIQGTVLLSRDTKFAPGKNVHIILVFATSYKGNPLFRGEDTFYLHSGDTALALKK